MASATQLSPDLSRREYMNLVIVGHVDHGKSTVIGRLLADTNSLPEGKLEQVKAMCERNSRPFEYAFLLDALKNEQAQGITIDTARCFFNTDKRRYIVNDAPGHIEFLKNMITGAARAEAALLVIDSEEGVQENSRRHGYLLSLLGFKQLAILVNKMDLVGYSRERFESIRKEYSEFLDRLGVHPMSFIPIAARDGVNIAVRSPEMPWYDGPSVLEQIDAFERPLPAADALFRMPVQDIYKFTADNDDRRIVAGTIESGSIAAGDEVVFLPSGKKSKIKSVEAFNAPDRRSIGAGYAAGFQMTTQIYIKPGELMCKASEPLPRVGSRLRVNLFWMGRAPLVKGKRYKLKIGAANVALQLAEIKSVIDASELSALAGKQQVDRHDVGECIFETERPIAFDRRNDVEQTGRFVVVDGYEIAGAGVILEPAAEGESLFLQNIRRREFSWERGAVNAEMRQQRWKHTGKCILFNGAQGSGKRTLSRRLEQVLWERGCATYYFGMANLFEDLVVDAHTRTMEHDEHVEKLGQLARVLTDAGLLMITTSAGLDPFDLERLKILNQPGELFVVNIGESDLDPASIKIQLDPGAPIEASVDRIVEALAAGNIIWSDYSI
jgi:bifunctional enzyme CysN/CysC